VSPLKRILGENSESTIQLNGNLLIALLDTGSNVSTISQRKFNDLFPDTEIQSLDKFKLDIEGAGGHQLPYCGYFEASVAVPGVSGQVDCLLLIVPDTRYAKRVPVILGTNVLKLIMRKVEQQHGTRFLQKADLPGSWYLTFRCMSIRRREVGRSNGRLCVVKADVVKKVVIPVNGTVTIPGRMNKQAAIPSCLGLTQQYDGSFLTTAVEVTPMLINFDKQETAVAVQLSNLGNSPVMVPPGGVMCQIQACDTDEQNNSSVMTDVKKISASILDKIDLSTSSLMDDQMLILQHFLIDWSHVFSHHDLDIGFTNVVKHKINLINDNPFKQRHRNIPPAMYMEVKQHLQELLDARVIRKSHSPWASNVVLVRKKDLSLRLCVDFRQLNKRTIKDAYALPRIHDILDNLGGGKYFTVLDMKSGYHQVELHDDHKERTAFTVGSLGFYQYDRLPFGLSNAPATYQRMMEQVLDELNGTVCHIYLDDVIIVSNSFKEHLAHIKQVFQRFSDTNLKLSPKKCSFFQTKVKYVGHIVSADGVQADPDKVAKVVNWPTPRDVDEVRSFLGFAGYYRRFVKNFSQLAKPLNELLVGISTQKKSRRKAKQVAFNWNDAQEESFQSLKQALVSPPILTYPDFTRSFVLHTDASLLGLGAVLYQPDANGSSMSLLMLPEDSVNQSVITQHTSWNS